MSSASATGEEPSYSKGCISQVTVDDGEISLDPASSRQQPTRSKLMGLTSASNECSSVNGTLLLVDYDLKLWRVRRSRGHPFSDEEAIMSPKNPVLHSITDCLKTPLVSPGIFQYPLCIVAA